MSKGIVLAILSLIIFNFASARSSHDPIADSLDVTAPGPDITAPGPDITAPGPDITAPGPDITAPGPDITAGRASGGKGVSKKLPVVQATFTQVNGVNSSSDSDSLSSSVQHMNANSWDLNVEPITSSQDVVLKKNNSIRSNDLTTGSGNPTAVTGDPTKGELAQFEKVLLPAGAYDKHPRCKIVVVRKASSSYAFETLTLGSGSQLRLSRVKIVPAGSGGDKIYNAKYDVIRDKEKKAELNLICDLSNQAAVSKSEIQAAFSKLGFVGTVPLGFKDSPKAASKEYSPSKATDGWR